MCKKCNYMDLTGDIGDGRIMTALNADPAGATGRHLGRWPQPIDEGLPVPVAVMSIWGNNRRTSNMMWSYRVRRWQGGRRTERLTFTDRFQCVHNLHSLLRHSAQYTHWHQWCGRGSTAGLWHRHCRQLPRTYDVKGAHERHLQNIMIIC